MPAGSAAGSRNFEPAQGYLYDAPDGIGAEDVWGLAGAKGKGITICDIEGNWNRKHEDLPTGIQLLGGTADRRSRMAKSRHRGAGRDGLDLRRQGAALASAIRPKPWSIPPSSTASSTPPAPISNAATRLKAGDVILIELQATGPERKVRRHAILARHLLRHQGGGRQGHHGCRGGRQRRREFRAADLQRTPACRRTAARSSSAQACRRPITWISTASAPASPPMLRSAFRARASSFPTTARSSTCRDGAGT